MGKDNLSIDMDKEENRRGKTISTFQLWTLLSKMYLQPKASNAHHIYNLVHGTLQNLSSSAFFLSFFSFSFYNSKIVKFKIYLCDNVGHFPKSS